MRANNIRAIIQAIRDSNGISRGAIRARTNLSHGTVSQMITALLEQGWILEVDSEEREGGRGRRSKRIVINPEGGCAPSFSLDTSGIHAAVYDLAGRLVNRVDIPLSHDVDTQQVLSSLHSLLGELLRGKEAGRALGVGIAVPGSVDTLTGVAQSASRIPGWKNVDFGKIRAAIDIPVYIDNDTRLLAHGHLMAGLIGDADVGLSVWLGEGVGSGITLSGRVFAGAHGLAGELGHLHIADDGTLCTCGNRGCLETVASAKSVRAAIRAAVNQGVASRIPESGDLDFKVIAAALEAGDKLAVTVCHDVAKAVAKALAQAINLLNPSIVILQGPMMHLGRPLMDGINQYLQLYAHFENRAKLLIKNAGPTVDHILLGAASMVLNNFWSSLSLAPEEYAESQS